jgi:hypothetical protein
MEVEKLAYIAGIVDGEGSIMIMRCASKAFMAQRAKRGSAQPHYHPSVRIGMQNRSALDLIVETFGFGKVYQEKAKPGRKPMFRFQIRSRDDVRNFLTPIMPYLLVKKEQAKLAIQFMNDWVSYGGIHLSPEVVQKRESAWMEMRKLNGVISIPATTKPRGRGGRDISAPFEAIV